MIYVTSDIHGYSLDEFKLFLDKVGFSDDDFCFVLGDVIDRGTDGLKWLKWLMVQPNFQLILGNHEAMLLSCDFLFETITEDAIDRLTGTKLGIYNNWISNGGQHTLDALSLLRESEVEDILDYLRDAPLYDTVTVGDKDFVLTHSGLGSFDKDKKLVVVVMGSLGSTTMTTKIKELIPIKHSWKDFTPTTTFYIVGDKLCYADKLKARDITNFLKENGADAESVFAPFL